MTLTPPNSRGITTLGSVTTVTGTATAADVLTATSATAAHWAAGGGSQTVLVQTFSLTAAQIKASTLTPVTVVAAPGANKLLVPLAFAYAYTFVTTPFSAPAVDLVYGPTDLNELFGVLDQGASQVGWALGHALLEGGARADYVNQPIKLAANLRGSIGSSSVTEMGSAYAAGDTGTVDDGTPDATYRIDTVSLGNVVTYTLLTAGGDYSLQAGRAPSEWTTTPGGAQPGAGSGFTINVASVDASGSAGDGTLAGTVYYVVADV